MRALYINYSFDIFHSMDDFKLYLENLIARGYNDEEILQYLDLDLEINIS